MHSDALDPARLNPLLRRALQGDPDAWEQLEPIARRLVKGVARAAHIPSARQEEFVDDVSQEVALGLVEAGPGAFDPTRASARTYVTAIARNCAASHRAFLPVVGRRRPRARNEAEESKVLGVVTIAAVPEEELPRRGRDTAGEVEAALDAQAILDDAPPLVVAALRGLHYEDRDLAEIAVDLGVSRTTLMRRVDAFVARVRETVAA